MVDLFCAPASSYAGCVSPDQDFVWVIETRFAHGGIIEETEDSFYTRTSASGDPRCPQGTYAFCSHSNNHNQGAWPFTCVNDHEQVVISVA